MASKKRKILRVVIIIMLSIAFALYVIMPALFGLFTSVRITQSVGEPPDGFAETTLKTTDSVNLAAWYKAPENGAAVLVIHGSNCSRETARPYAEFLAEHGYGVIAIDLRGHGESQGAANALGWQRGKDIEAVLEFLRNEGIENIGALGLSLGGESLLGECWASPEIKAVVSDGATHSSLADYLVLPSRESLVRSWTTRVMYASAQLFTGQTPPVTTMLDSIKASKDTRFVFIAAEDTEEEVEYNTVFAEAAKGRSELWVVPEAGHTQAFHLYPDEYESRVIAFFNAALFPQG